METLKVTEPRIHELKTWPEFYHYVASSEKTFEVRKDDRDFRVGDTLHLREYCQCQWCDGTGKRGHPGHNFACNKCEGMGGSYTGRSVRKVVIYKMPGGRNGIEKSYCILGLLDLTTKADRASVQLQRILAGGHKIPNLVRHMLNDVIALLR